MTRHEQPSALRPEILAARVFCSLVAEHAKGASTRVAEHDMASLAVRACDAAAVFIATWKRRNPDTAERRFEGQDVPEARGLAAGIGVGADR